MTREEIIETMIDTVNTYNIGLMKEAKASDQQIADAVASQRPAFENMFALIYKDLETKGAFN